MALVTVQRSPCGTNSPGASTSEVDGPEATDGDEESTDKKGISECYFAVKGAALVLPHDECLHVHRKTIANGACDIQQHLQSMLYLLHADDILKMAVKLESIHSSRTRYLVVVYHNCGEYQQEESCLLGIDCNKETTIGLLLPVWADTRITLDGDGGFSVTSNGRHHIFKPVSVQAMWSALQTLHKASSKARENNYFKCGGTHHWVEYYEKRIASDRSCLNEWHAMDDIESRRPPSPDTVRVQPTEREETERHIRMKLKELMMSVDLDEVTSKYIRTRLEEILDMNLKEYKSFIDQEMLTILGQMDSPTEIFQYLYLGSEWNASNLEELVVNGIGHILNVTREIDNFFPGMFDYQNIRVYDDESTEILHYWDKTYRYIRRAKDEGSKVLVHCKMGISRSASVVIAYVMKAYDWDLQRALDFVKTKRGCIKPNSGFLKQLEIYQGILDASKQRHNSLWRSKSETNLKSATKPKKKDDGEEEKKQKVPEKSESLHHLTVSNNFSVRPKSWSPSDVVADMLFPTTNIYKNDRLSIGQTFSSHNLENLNYNLKSTSSLNDFVQSKAKQSTEKDKSTELLNSTASLPRVSSIKDRINELELQVTSTSDKTTKSEMKSPTSQNRSGLVFSLANQFESGSKPSSPVDEGLVMKSSLEEAIVQPVLSQMKPPVCKHHAVLVKPVWPDDNRTVPEPVQLGDGVLSQNISKISSKMAYPILGVRASDESCDISAQKLTDEPSLKTSHSAFKPLNAYTNSHMRGPMDKRPSQIQQSSPDICQTSTLHTGLSERKTVGVSLSNLSIERSLNSNIHVKDVNKILEPISPIKNPFKNQDSSLVASQVRLPVVCGANQGDVLPQPNYFYDKEDIPFTPGKVLRTKQKIEEKNLTRTTSFDSGFPLRTHSTPSTPPESESGKLIRRSHSLRNDCRSTVSFCGKWYPLPALASDAPLSFKRNSQCLQNNNVILSVSTPSVVEAVNRVICGTQEVLSSAIPFMPPQKKASSSSDSDFDFGSASSLPDIDSREPGRSPPVHRESPVPGLVKLQREILENKVTKPFSLENNKTKKDALKLLSSEQGSSLVISDASKCETIKESGIVKRLKKELEAKSTSDNGKKERSVGAGLPEVEDTEHCGNKLMLNVYTTEKHACATNLPSSSDPPIPKLRTSPCSSTRKKSTYEEQKAPPTPHRKTSLDLSFMQKRFPLNIKLASQPTVPIVKPNSRTTFNIDCKTPCDVSAAASPSDLLAKTTCISDIPPIGLPRKMRKQQGSTHPLSKLIKQRHPNPLYNTM
ncbi:protein phosphatase Slingshot [Nephila pilipes]|uniref:protein-serine/threonine phosphatase n=1 Tax=Nephila pilipes TaxID=299642 RepID=A0A8X6Q1V5_NEPPI|nr:protein phosphatase Slingshot [Nephila pilipes]